MNRHDASSEVEDYLLDCLAAIRRGRALPPRPPSLDEQSASLDRDIERLEAAVVAEHRAIERRQIHKPLMQGESTPIGHQVPGYEIVEVLGEGRFGTVYKAIDQRLRGRVVALKLIKKPVRDTLLDDRRWEQVFGEAKRASILNHSHIVKCLDHGLLPEASGERRAFIVMDYIEGGTLEQRVARNRAGLDEGRASSQREPWGKLRQAWVARMIAAIAEATHAAHLGRMEHGLPGTLHGDISPKNILIDSQDVPHLTDFGLSLNHGDRYARGGTEGFMAPELTRRGTTLSPAVDIFSLGATLHFALFGRPPGAIDTDGVPPERSIARDLDAVRRRCLQPDPSRRYSTARELADDLHRYLVGEPVLARPVSMLIRFVKVCQRHSRITAVVAVLACLATPFAVSYIQQYFRIQRLSSALQLTLPLAAVVDPEKMELDDDIPVQVRKAVADRLIPFFDGLSELGEGSVSARSAKAEAMAIRAKLFHSIGTTESDANALKDLIGASTLYRGLPATIDRDVKLASLAVIQVGILGPMRRFDEGIAILDPAIDSLNSIVRDQPDHLEAKYRLSRALGNRANCRAFLAATEASANPIHAKELLKAAETDDRAALGYALSLPRTVPESPRYLEWTSRLSGNLGLVLLQRIPDLGKAAEVDSEKMFVQAVDLAEKTRELRPGSSRLGDVMATALINLGEGQLQLGQARQAELSYRRAFELSEELTVRFLGQRDFPWNAALSLGCIAKALNEQGKPDAALEMIEQSHVRYDHLVRMYPEVKELAVEQQQLLGVLKQSIESNSKQRKP